MSCCGKKTAKKKYGVPFTLRKIKNKKKVEMQMLREPAMKTFLLCRPKYYNVNYEINPWMHLNNKANQKLALEQWDNLKDRINEHGGKAIMITPQKDLPDMVFTANAGLKYKNIFIASNFKYE